MMTTSIRSIGLAALLAACCVPPLRAQGEPRLAAIAGGDREGVGILRPRAAGECFVVSPAHVADPESPGPLSAVLDGGTHVPLESVLERYSADLALWRMTRRTGRGACAAWPAASAVNRVLERADRRGTLGVLTPWTLDGPGQRIPVRIHTLTRTTFAVAAAGEVGLKTGMSGSPVYVNGTLVGIVTDIDADGGHGVVLRLDYVETHLAGFFYPGRRPNDLLIVASIAAPGLGQLRTRRSESAILWAGMAAGPSLYALLATKDEQLPRTRQLPDGREEIYYESRQVTPYRDYAWIPWVAVGFLSFLEARGYAGRYYIPPERSETRRSAALRLRPALEPGADGGTRVRVAELRF